MSIMRNSQVVAVGAASAEITSALIPGHEYMLISTTNCWFRMSATGTAAVAATANNVYLPADTPMSISCDSADAGFISIIQASGPGTACLTVLE